MQTPEDSSSHDNEKNPPKPKKMRTSKASKRFSDEQIKSLESIFKVEDKLEQRKKLKIAKDLGLQPRQVAIWFQNRRARWKSKQMEQDYRVLKANYDSLCLEFDDMKREKQTLEMKLKELRDVMKNLQKDNLSDRDGEFKENPDSSNEGMDHSEDMCNNDKENIIKNCGKIEVLSWGEEDEEISHLASNQTWCNLPSAGIFDDSSNVSDWWDS